MDTQATEVENYYQQRIKEVTGVINRLSNKKSAFAWLRLGSILAIFLSFYLLWQAGVLYVFIASAILLFIFIRLVYADLSNHESIRFHKKLLSHYEDELKALKGEFLFEDGSQYIDKTHPYTSDLDIFGKGSLFQYINRTNTEPGSDTLAGYFKARESTDLIHKRQEAVKGLARENEWLKAFQTTASLHKFTNQSKARLEQWFGQPSPLSNNLFITGIRFLVPATVITITVLFIAGKASESLFYAALLLSAIIVWQFNKIVTPIHNQLSDINKQLKSLSESIKLIEQKSFSNPLLSSLQSHLGQNQIQAANAIRKLGRQMDRLDMRYNLMISLPLNLLLLWDLQQITSLEKWKAQWKNIFPNWVDTVAAFEALNSLAIFSFNNPNYVFPNISEGYFLIKGTSVGHPLITADKRVANNIDIPSKGKIMLVTGSNMAGKSTYLRSIGVNCVLAFCGAPVCATEFQVSGVAIISSMRIEDNLQESTSTFYAELKKLKAIIDRVNQGEKVFILLDEILRGTNSTDRHTGSKALIRQLIEKQSVAIIATHDLELAAMKDTYREHIDNYHFDVQVNGEELYFDYKLKEGICKSMNASILMKKIGIELG